MSGSIENRIFLVIGILSTAAILCLILIALLFGHSFLLDQQITRLIDTAHGVVGTQKELIFQDWHSVGNAIDDVLSKDDLLNRQQRETGPTEAIQLLEKRMTWHGYGIRSKSIYVDLNLNVLENVFRAKNSIEFKSAVFASDLDAVLVNLPLRIPPDFFLFKIDLSQTSPQQTFLRENSADLAAFAPWPDVVELSQVAAAFAVAAFRKGDWMRTNQILTSVVRWSVNSEIPLSMILLKRTFMLMNFFHELDARVHGTLLKDPLRITAVAEMLPYFLEPAMVDENTFELLKKAPRSLLCSGANLLSDAYFFQHQNFPRNRHSQLKMSESVLYGLFDFCRLEIVRRRVANEIPSCSVFEGSEVTPKLKKDLGPLGFLMKGNSGAVVPILNWTPLREYLKRRALRLALRRPYYSLKNYGANPSDAKE